MKKLLIVDDDRNITSSLYRLLNFEPYEIYTTNDPREAIELAASNVIDVLLTDQRMPRICGRELLTHFSENHPGVARLGMSAHQDFEAVVEAFNDGLLEQFIPKPWDNDLLKQVLGKYLDEKKSSEVRQLSTDPFSNIITSDPCMLALFDKIRHLSDNSAPVFIYGETGTGKELIARALHGQSSMTGRFIAFNCSNFSPELLESQLFGHKKGAFTGAIADQQGLLAAADQGSLFLDEVTDLPPPVQSKLLRALQEREFTPVGSTVPIKFESRIITASSTRIQDAVLRKEFRPDLMYRLEVIPLDLPPLRDRQDDINLLFNYFTANRELGCGVTEMLNSYHWPGNVRELENTVRYAIAFSGDGEIKLEHLPERITRPVKPDSSPETDVTSSTPARYTGSAKPTPERIIEALQMSNNNRSAAARRLGVSRMSLYRYLKAHQLEATNN